jgi:hypothetical protein
MIPSLDRQIRPADRAVTALGRLVALVREAVSGDKAHRPDDGLSRWWSNRPGQDRAETAFLAWSVTLTVSGLSAGLLARWLAPDSIAGWFAVAMLAIPGFFAGIHALIFAASAIDALLRLVGVRVTGRSSGHFCGRLFLGLLTGVCLSIAIHPEAGHWLRAISVSWLTLAAGNGIAWVGFEVAEMFGRLGVNRK